MTRLLAATALAAFLLATPPPAGAQPFPAGMTVGVPAVIPAGAGGTAVTDTLRALDRLRSFGYSINSPARAERAIKAWQRANGLAVDGQVGPKTLESLGLVQLSGVKVGPPVAPPTNVGIASVPAVRVDPPVSAPAPPAGDVEAVIRDVFPDELEDRAVAIATRESRLQSAVINRNGNATGLFQIMWTVHRGWLCPQLGVCAQSDLQDARINAGAALALYQRSAEANDGYGWGPWRLG